MDKEVDWCDECNGSGGDVRRGCLRCGGRGYVSKIDLTYPEEIELRYLSLRGFRYLVRNEIGSVEVFANKPVRDKVVNGRRTGGYDQWVETNFPITFEERQRRQDVKLGKYEFIKWEDEPVKIEDLLSL